MESTPISRKGLLILSAITGSILLIPAIAMNAGNGVHWDVFDFVIAGTLIFSTGFAVQWLYRQLKTKKYRMAIVAAIVLMAVLIAMEMAVGLFGTPLAGN